MSSEVDMGESPPAPNPITYQQFHDLFVIRGSVQAFKCNYETGDVEFWLFGGGGNGGGFLLKTRVTPKEHLKEALQAFSEGRDWQAPPPPPLAISWEATPLKETYQVGESVVAKDRSGNWYCGQILKAVSDRPRVYEVGFTGFESHHNHVQHVECIRPQLSYPRPPKDFPAGTKVLYYDAAQTYRKCFEGKVDQNGRVVDVFSERAVYNTLVMALL